MSVLNFPRIYLNGFMFWNPPTFNNNDVLPLYDAVKMQMNWRFLNKYEINDKNAPQTLMPWAIAPLAYQNVPDYVLQVPTNGDPNSYPMIPAEWDLFGDNACGTVNYQQLRSVIIGGESKVDSYIDSDPLINKSYQLLGNPFGNPSPTAARFVDVSPWQNTFTALYFDKLVLGDATCGLTLKHTYRMLNRFLDFNWGAFGGLVYVTATWQTCFPKDQLEWVIGDSKLLKNLQDEMLSQNAQGLMIRFTTYLTVYDQNGLFNDFKNVDSHSKAPWDMSRLQMLYQMGLDNPTETFFNPAYSRTAGTLGLWFANEFPTAPGGQRLAPKDPVPFYKKVPGDTVIHQKDQRVNLGVLSAQLNGSTLSLDLGNTFPIYPAVHDGPAAPDLDGRNNAIPVAAKFHVGDYELGVQQGSNFEPLTSIGFDQYQQSAFDKRSGLLDLPLDAGAQALLKKGNLALRLKGTDTIAAQQQMWTAEVIESGSFIDVGDRRTLNIMVQSNGQPAPAGTTLWVAEYNNAFMLTTSNYYLAFSNPADFVLITDYPDARANNQPGMPQFSDGSQHPSLLREGSGRRLSAMMVRDSSACDEPVSNAITYQEFLETPAAVDLRPCLKFDNPQPMTGTLDNDAGLGATVNYSLASITTNADGIAQLTVQAVAPGFPTLRFFIQDDPAGIPFSFSYTDAFTDFLSPLRVLPQEPQMLKDFITYWNGVCKFDDANVRIWNGFIFPQILQPFYYLYPIMNKYMPLNSLQRIEGAIEQFITLISKEYQEASTLAMPITRDLPQSRRQVLEIWAKDLVSTGYPPTQLNLDDYQQG